MIDLKKPTRRRNDMYEAPIGRVFHVRFPDYLDSSTRIVTFRLIAHVGDYNVILQTQCNQVIFKAEIVCMNTILLDSAFNLDIFMESKLPEDELFRIGEVLYFEPNSEKEWQFEYSLSDDEMEKCV